MLLAAAAACTGTVVVDRSVDICGGAEAANAAVGMLVYRGGVAAAGGGSACIVLR